MLSSALPEEGMLAAKSGLGNQVVASTLKAACVGCMMLRQGSMIRSIGVATTSPIATDIRAASCLTSDNAIDDLSGPRRSL
jgi:hypothetical protein